MALSWAKWALYPATPGGKFMRSRHRSKDNNKSKARLAQQQKIKVCNEFTKPFSGSGFFNKSFAANDAIQSVLVKQLFSTFQEIILAGRIL